MPSPASLVELCIPANAHLQAEVLYGSWNAVCDVYSLLRCKQQSVTMHVLCNQTYKYVQGTAARSVTGQAMNAMASTRPSAPPTSRCTANMVTNLFHRSNHDRFVVVVAHVELPSCPHNLGSMCNSRAASVLATANDLRCGICLLMNVTDWLLAVCTERGPDCRRRLERAPCAPSPRRLHSALPA